MELGNGLSEEDSQRVIDAIRNGLNTEAGAKPPLDTLGAEPAHGDAPARTPVRPIRFLIPWSIGVALALVPLASPYQAPLISLIEELELGRVSALVSLFAILLARLLAGGLLGAAIGYFQGRGLSVLTGSGAGWIGACSVSYALGDVANILVLGQARALLAGAYAAGDPLIRGTAAEPILGPLAALVSLIGSAVLFGGPYALVIAIPQWLNLRKRISKAWRWLVVYPTVFSLSLGLAFALAWLVGLILYGGSQLGDPVVTRAMQLVGLLIWPIPAALLSGAGMAAIARNPVAQAT